MLGAAIALVCSLAPPDASAAESSLAAAQARITAAQEAANRASAAYEDAQGRYYQLQDDAVLTRKRVTAARTAEAGLLAVVRQRAVQLYIRAGSTGFDLFRSTGGVLDASRRATLAAAANAGDDVVIAQLGAVTDDLNAHETTLRSEISDAKAALSDLKAQQDDLQKAVTDATQAEQQLRAELERERRANEYAAIVQRAD